MLLSGRDQQADEEQIRAFAHDGAVCIRGLLSAAELALLARGIEKNLAAPGPFAKIASQADDPGFFFEDFCNWQRIPEYREFVFDSAVAAIAGQLMKSRTVRFYHDHLLVKEPKTAQRTPWHQDQPYYNIEGRMNISVWIPIDPVARESTLEFLAGSHCGPWLMPRSFMTAQAKWFPEGSLADLPEVEQARDQYSILGWALEPGDAVFFHMLTLHAAAGVGAARRRRVLSLRFLGDDIRHAPRAWSTSPPFPGLVDDLPAGAPMNHVLFPILKE